MALPKEPRQKMINLMYLVLTALLALNVSSEILNAFKTVNNSLGTSNEVIEQKNQTLFKSFQEKLNQADTKEKAAIWWPKAEKAKQLSENMYAYIESLKDSLKRASGYNPPKDTTFKEDDLEASSRLMVEEKKGNELQQKLIQFKKDLLAIDTGFAMQYAATLPLDVSIPKTAISDAAKKDWAYAYFNMTPTIAGITILSKFQNDVKNSEARAVEYFHNKIGEVKMVFDTYVPLIGQSAQYLMPGQELDVTAGIGAFNKESRPSISIDGASVPLQPDGTGLYKTTVGGPGSYVKKLHISYFNQATGKQETKDVDIKYTVGSPTGANVSADATRVLYIGVANPVTVIGGAGVGDEKVSVSISQGSLTKTGPGHYEAQVTTPGEATITVNDGKNVTPFKFRVKTIPDPVAKVGNSKGGRMALNEFKAMAGVRADLENFIFENLKYNVLSYTFIATGKAFSERPGISVNNGAVFNNETRALIEKLGPNSTVLIDMIKVEGPNGTTTLPPISFYLY
ncbi:MAG: gliding motility protein GldM [Sphingobacteriales bacterium]|uniref:type IX secretion system motor protein PorM/GldM n=1 Tax=Hydrotalea flava TaxID=714549 RepID=UPI00082ED0EB|nr:gliding motility protein GldM [Hydrotalea flava]RTL49029.1 MAG: gliding motility protein GldM [Sphingobacteriales bacterium]